MRRKAPQLGRADTVRKHLTVAQVFALITGLLGQGLSCVPPLPAGSLP